MEIIDTTTKAISIQTPSPTYNKKSNDECQIFLSHLYNLTVNFDYEKYKLCIEEFMISRNKIQDEILIRDIIMYIIAI